MQIVCFDFETGGLHPANASVLSVAAVKANLKNINGIWDIDGERTDYERYYMPEKPTHPKAIAVNGLTNEHLLDLREDVEYPDFFSQDTSDLISFFEGTDLVIAHNYKFDKKWLPSEFPKIAHYCTMLSSMAWCGLKRNNTNKLKYPKLQELADKLDIEYEESALHDALGDTLILYDCFIAMLRMDQFAIQAGLDKLVN